MSDDYDFDAPDSSQWARRQVGDRLFLLHAARAVEMTVKVEKQQVAVLAGYLGRIVRELDARANSPTTSRSTTPRSPSGWSAPSASPTTRSRPSHRGGRGGGRRGRGEEEEEERRHGRGQAARRPHPGAGRRLRHPGHTARGGRTAALPPVRAPLGPLRARLPPDERPPPARELAAVPDPEVERVLVHGEMTVHGRIAGSSNATLLVTCRWRATSCWPCTSRPRASARCGTSRAACPPRGRRLRAAETLGWGLVPETVGGAEAPFGPGSVQRFVHEDGTSHYFTLRDDPAWHPVLIAWPRSTSWPTTPTARAATSCWPRAGCGPSTTASASQRGQAAHGHLGLRRRAARRRREEDLARLAKRGLPRRLGELLEPDELAATWNGRPVAHLGPSPSSSPTGTGPPTPGHRSEGAGGGKAEDKPHDRY